MILNNKSFNKPFIYWLSISFFLILLMISVGGATRLTDSGLSITEWELFTGILPPLNENKWQEYFTLYKKIPQYKFLNYDMNIDQFKIIFYWEYYHRLLGRLIGLFFLIPLIYFTYKKIINKNYLINFYSIFLLIFLQGVIGWYMVTSGLTNNVDVSHFRLSLHLSIAFVIIAAIYWNLLNILNNKTIIFFKLNKNNYKIKFLLFLIFLQIILGAFVSGLDAGKIYQTWPLMNNNLLPDDIKLNTVASFFDFNERSLLQFYHRNIAYLVLIYFIIFGIKNINTNGNTFKYNFIISSLFLSIQVILGIFTLISGLNIILALLHQFMSIILFLSVVRLIYTFEIYSFK